MFKINNQTANGLLYVTQFTTINDSCEFFWPAQPTNQADLIAHYLLAVAECAWPGSHRNIFFTRSTHNHLSAMRWVWCSDLHICLGLVDVGCRLLCPEVSWSRLVDNTLCKLNWTLSICGRSSLGCTIYVAFFYSHTRENGDWKPQFDQNY